MTALPTGISFSHQTPGRTVVLLAYLLNGLEGEAGVREALGPLAEFIPLLIQGHALNQQTLERMTVPLCVRLTAHCPRTFVFGERHDQPGQWGVWPIEWVYPGVDTAKILEVTP